MRVGVIAELVTFMRHPRAQLGMLLGAFADDEERAGSFELREGVEQRRRAIRIRTVVERQRDHAAIAVAVRCGVHGPIHRALEATVAKKIREPDSGAASKRCEEERQQHASGYCDPRAGRQKCNNRVVTAICQLPDGEGLP